MNNLRVYYPLNFNSFFNLIDNYSINYIIYNEIDYKFLLPELKKNDKSKNIFLINNFEKFAIISLKGNFLEIGSCVTYEKIIDFKEKNVPGLLYEFISRINDKIMLNSINISNGFYLKGSIFDSFPLFLCLDVYLEFKDIESKKSYTVSSYNIDRKKYIRNKDRIILSKIKIPIINSWDRGYYYRSFFDGDFFENFECNNFVFVFVFFNVRKDFISDFFIKIFFSDSDKMVVFRDFQLFLLNKTLPLSCSEIEDSLNALNRNIKDIKNINIDETNFKLIKNFYIDVLKNLESKF